MRRFLFVTVVAVFRVVEAARRHSGRSSTATEKIVLERNPLESLGRLIFPWAQSLYPAASDASNDSDDVVSGIEKSHAITDSVDSTDQISVQMVRDDGEHEITQEYVSSSHPHEIRLTSLQNKSVCDGIHRGGTDLCMDLVDRFSKASSKNVMDYCRKMEHCKTEDYLEKSSQQKENLEKSVITDENSLYYACLKTLRHNREELKNGEKMRTECKNNIHDPKTCDKFHHSLQTMLTNKNRGTHGQFCRGFAKENVIGPFAKNKVIPADNSFAANLHKGLQSGKVFEKSVSESIKEMNQNVANLAESEHAQSTQESTSSPKADGHPPIFANNVKQSQGQQQQAKSFSAHVHDAIVNEKADQRANQQIANGNENVVKSQSTIVAAGKGAAVEQKAETSGVGSQQETSIMKTSSFGTQVPNTDSKIPAVLNFLATHQQFQGICKQLTDHLDLKKASTQTTLNSIMSSIIEFNEQDVLAMEKCGVQMENLVSQQITENDEKEFFEKEQLAKNMCIDMSHDYVRAEKTLDFCKSYKMKITEMTSPAKKNTTIASQNSQLLATKQHDGKQFMETKSTTPVVTPSVDDILDSI